MDKYEYRTARLKLLIDTKYGGVHADFAKSAGIDPSYVSRMLYPSGKEGRKRIGEATVEKIHKLHPHWMNERSDRIELAEKTERIEELERSVAEAPDIRGFVPLIGWVQAGEFSEAMDLQAVGEGEKVPITVQKKRHTFALTVVNDSMMPDFPPGMRLVVEPEMEAIPGDFVIAKNGGEATFKQLVKDGGDWYLKPLNPQYPTKPLGESRIIGVVREAVRKLR